MKKTPLSRQKNGNGRSFRRTHSVIAMSALAGTLICFSSISPAMASSPTTTSISWAYRPTVAARQVQASAKVTPLSSVKADLNAYFKAGYTYGDALDLAVLWGSSTRGGAKIAGGAALLKGTKMPFAPGGGYTRSYTTVQGVAAYVLSDYQGDYSEALRLAALWGSPTVMSAKAKAGAALLANRVLPVPKAFTVKQDVSAFAKAGYTYRDAVKLVKLWHTVSPWSAKIRAGINLLSVPQIALPIRH